MSIPLSDLQGRHVRQALADVKNYLDNTLKPMLTSMLGQHAGLPQQLTEFLAELTKLGEALQPGSAVSSAASIPDALAPVLATVTAYYRRRFATDLDERRARALTGDLLQNLDSARAEVDELLKARWYRSTTPLRLPRLRDFVAKSRYDQGNEPTPPRRTLDDKFYILWSASELWSDLFRAREQCEERFAPVGIAFVDVDGLKALNTDLGEPWVDALVLPPLMRSIERVVFGHGYAYRYGGDEFVLLMPSADQEVAVAILRQVRRNIATTPFERVVQPPTVSIGLCVLEPDSPLTDREALQWAAHAKRGAKERRNAIGVVSGSREIDTRVVTVLPD